MMTKRAWITAICLAIVHIVFALMFSVATPYRQPGRIFGAPALDVGAPDEIAHEQYIQHIWDGKGIPSLDVPRLKTDHSYRQLGYEFLQPPLYYLADAAWGRALGAQEVSDPTSALKIRSLNAIVGGCTVLGVFAAALWGFDSLFLAFLAAAIGALIPMNIALSSAVSNDPLLIALCSWTLALCAKGLRSGWQKWQIPAVVVLAALALYTKSTGIALAPILLLALLLPQTKRPNWKVILCGAAGYLALIAPLMLRNQSLYGDPLAIKVFNEAFQDTQTHAKVAAMIAKAGGTPGYDYWVSWVGWWTFRSFVGVFGYMSVWLNATNGPFGSQDPVYRVSLAVCVLLGIGWVASLKGMPRIDKSVTVLNGAFLLLILLAFLKFNDTYFQAQGRYLYPAIAPIAIGLASGALYLGRKKQALVVTIATLVLFALALSSWQKLRTNLWPPLTNPTVGIGPSVTHGASEASV